MKENHFFVFNYFHISKKKSNKLRCQSSSIQQILSLFFKRHRLWRHEKFSSRLKWMRWLNRVRGSIVVSIPACHAGNRGSIPRRGVSFFFFCSFWQRNSISLLVYQFDNKQMILFSSPIFSMCQHRMTIVAMFNISSVNVKMIELHFQMLLFFS